MKRSLRIVFTSDIHGHMFPTNYISPAEKPMGLFSLAADYNKDGNTLVIDGGDTLQGSPFSYFAAHEGHVDVIAQALNEAGYDYVVPGNHDFNYGHGAMKTYFSALQAKCLAANVSDNRGEIPFAASAVHTLENGLRVGLVGVVTDWVNKWEKKENIKDFSVTDTLSGAKRAYEEIRGKCDVSVCIYHGGVERNLETGEIQQTSGENIACKIIDEIPFDIMLTSHQHIAMENLFWKNTHICQNPPNGTHFALVSWQEGGKAESRLIPAKATKNAPENAIETEKLVQKWLDTPISELSCDMLPEEPIRMALHSSPIANLFNRVQLLVSGSDLSSTSLANEVRGFHKTVTVRDVVSTYIYPNTLTELKITGKELKLMLETCASYFDIDENGKISVSDAFLTPKVAHYNYDFIAGVQYAFDITRPVGSRVIEITRNGEAVKNEDTFTMCVNNYRATGVGGYEFLADCPHTKEILTEMSEILLDFFRTNPYVEADFESAYKVYAGNALVSE
ncbi:MAG: bifunctional metallophosphatase/5'-nucleotidase [Clostridia bacterium]|nr:bifunctional metallophosphatase/5'-nucleotidase [Clostridia bacterium]MBQ4156716.1 bifunctional metallophosphatase/5'-nucleotidase [Clostridia bacterium]